MKKLIIVFLVLLNACASHSIRDEEGFLTSFPYSVGCSNESSLPCDHSTMQAAVDLWNDAVGQEVFYLDDEAPEIEVFFEDGLEDFYNYLTKHNKEINSRTQKCIDEGILTQEDCVNAEKFAPFGLANPDYFEVLIFREAKNRGIESLILAHELGHIIGFSHDANNNSIMFPGNKAHNVRITDEMVATMKRILN